MHLKRLEIQGFKSFADKIDFQIDKGVTIVVGPNGSGKSNISDSIRWVIGEQSAKTLRGAKMEDIIFSGSAKRKPVGMAEVSITFDNSTGIFPVEFNEVTVTRRVYRSGESDFLINKKSCRLRDIHELFMDTGLGKETYSIIGQGQVDQILNAKPEERRVFIEEAAGIVKYRTRKQEALRKLNDTEQNLLRINDIIVELESQIEPLREQSEKAIEFQGYKTELDCLEINLAVHQIEEQKTKLTEAQAQVNGFKEELSVQEVAYQAKEHELEQGKLNVQALNEELTTKQQKVFELSAEVSHYENEIKLIEQKVTALAEQRQRLERDQQLEQTKLNQLANEHGAENDKLQRLQLEIGQVTEELTQTETQFAQIVSGLSKQEAELEEHKNELFDLLGEMAANRNRINSNDNDIISLRRRMSQVKESLNKHEGERLQGEQALVVAKGSLANCNQEQEALVVASQELRSTKQDLEVRSQALGKDYQSLTREIQANESRLKVLVDMQEEFEGYQKGVKTVLQAAKKGEASCTGVCGVVAELMRVPQKYEIAIEVTLGGALQNIVTETDGDAKKAIEFLKRAQAGRATFLPLNTVSAQSPKANELEAVKMAGAIGFAGDLVEFDPKYAQVVASMLGRVVIVEDIDKAVKIAQKTGYRVRLVTLDGDVINPGGSLSGGSYQKRGSNLLGRNREIDQLKDNIAKKQERFERLVAEEAALKEQLNDLSVDLETKRELIQNLQVEKVSQEKECQRLEIELKRTADSLELLLLEQKENQTELDSKLEDLKRLEDNLQEQATRQKELEGLIEQQQQIAKGSVGEREAYGQSLTDIKVRLAGIQQEEVNLKQGLKRYFAELKAYQEGIAAKDIELQELEQRRVELTQQMADLGQQVLEAVAAKEQAEQGLSELKFQRDQVQTHFDQLESLAKLEFKAISEGQQRLHQAEMKLAKFEIEVENGLTRLLEEFELSYEQALLQKQPLANKREATSRIVQLKGLIQGLGVINLGAIEEYERVRERYEFLQKQFVDLEAAKQSLYQVIDEMNQIMKERFAATFAVVKENFTEAFIALFGGGTAELQLTNSEDMLETGIDIVAQPPGKKRQHLSLLSGGERALTAISLLFAILKHKPSPFCVLDEIEAALDEANVKRFADFVKEFSQKTQFIVVTHRKGTMEVADVLYGVTMDEAGVSKIVSMKFSDDLVAS